jgi:hypothetical protein
MKKAISYNLLHKIAVIATIIGAIGSLGFMIYTGRKNPSIVLILMFLIWVLSPFIGLFIANIISKTWSLYNRSILYWLMLVLSITSLVGYSGILIPLGTKPAFIFLVIPFISWLVIIIFFLTVKKTSSETTKEFEKK